MDFLSDTVQSAWYGLYVGKGQARPSQAKLRANVIKYKSSGRGE